MADFKFANCNPNGFEPIASGIAKLLQRNIDEYLDSIIVPLYEDVKMGADSELFKATKNHLGDVSDEYVREYMFSNGILVVTNHFLMSLIHATRTDRLAILSVASSVSDYIKDVDEFVANVLLGKTSIPKLSDDHIYRLEVLFPFLLNLYQIDGNGLRLNKGNRYSKKVSYSDLNNISIDGSFLSLSLDANIPIGVNDSNKPAPYVVGEEGAQKDVVMYADAYVNYEHIPAKRVKAMFSEEEDLFLASTSSEKSVKMEDAIDSILQCILESMEYAEDVGNGAYKLSKRETRESNILLTNSGVGEDMSTLMLKGFLEIIRNREYIREEHESGRFSFISENLCKGVSCVIQYPYGYTGNKPRDLNEWLEEIRLIKESGCRRWSYDIIYGYLKDYLFLHTSNINELVMRYENIVNSATEAVSGGKKGNYMSITHEGFRYLLRRLVAYMTTTTYVYIRNHKDDSNVNEQTYNKNSDTHTNGSYEFIIRSTAEMFAII